MERPTLGMRLNAARLNRFVGREREIETFRAAFENPDIAVLYIHGPGGVGKSSLLDVFGQVAREASSQVLRIDARDIDLTPAGFMSAVEAARRATHAWDDEARLVLMLDTWERAAPVDAWLRDIFLPTLEVNTFIVISSRNPPGAEWTADRSWGPLIAVMGVRNFLPHETTAFLRNQVTSPARYDAIAEISYGHPLALALLCALERQDVGSGVETFRDRPDIVQSLLARCLDVLPDAEQRLALAICAHVRVTTEELLREAMEIDGALPLFDWLRELSIIQEGPHGIFPHDLARDVIDADFRWRGLERYTEMHARVRRPIVRRILSQRGLEQQQAAADLIYLHRNGPVLGQVHHWASVGQGTIEPATPSDLPDLLALVEQFEGPDAAAIARYWWMRSPESFFAFRRLGNDPAGFNVSLILSEPDAESLAIDPAIAGMWRAIDARAPLRPGEVVCYERFLMDREAHHAPSVGSNLMSMSSLLHWITTPNLGWSMMAITDRSWEPAFTYLDQVELVDAEFSLGDREYLVYGHDWRVLPFESWLELMAGREIAADPPPPGVPTEYVIQVLSRPDFKQAVRHALRDIHDPQALARNPLGRSRLAIGERDAAVILRERLLAAIGSLEHAPRDAKLFRAIDRTYLRPAASQELAAEALGLPFNTYRYHLSGAVRRIVDELWRIELAA